MRTRLTPMFRQYFEVKNRYPDCILFFRLGDFYEMFFEDAEEASRILDIALTSREAGGGQRAPMCGVPVANAAPYIRRLIEAGKKVAICEQVEDPREARGLVRREVVRVITPGLFVDPEGLSDKESHYLCALRPGKRWGLAVLELSAGQFRAAIFEDRRELVNEVFRLEPRELLLPENAPEDLRRELREGLPGLAFTPLPAAAFSEARARELLSEHFGVEDPAGLGFAEIPEALSAVGAVLEYLLENEREALGRISPPRPYFPGDYLVLDEATKRNLELTRNQFDGSVRHSLLWVLDRTRTAMGGRTLRHWLLYPLKDIAAIRSRQEAITTLLEDATLREGLAGALSRIPDLERLATRCALRLAGPRDLVALREALAALPEVRDLLAGKEGLISEIRERLSDFSHLEERLRRTLLDEVPATAREGGLVRPGVHPELDELRDLKENALRYLAEIEERERRRTGIPNLKVGYNRVFGYYLEVTKSHLSRVPKDYIRKQTLTNAERFITPELKEFEARVLSADERIRELEYEIFLGLREAVSGEAERLRQAARALGELDALVSLAEVAEENRYVRPEVVPEPGIEIVEGRHPVLERVLPAGSFVPNTVRLDPEEARLVLITGPNMAGKSTVLRQTALIVLMAHTGAFVPAESARIGLCDRIFSRIGASDELSRGRSTFMVEMAECANILHNATERSLVILDEIGRGTSTYDGLAIAWAVAEYLHEKGALTLFATHYHELTELARELPAARNYNVAVKTWEDRIIFLYRLQPGPASESYGVQVAALAGLPREVVERAREILSALERKAAAEPPPRPPAGRDHPRQLSLFDPYLPLREKLLAVDPEELTPRQALNLIFELRDLLVKSGL
ncbi:DNA mismatch repair protein MutS [Thermosulfurimonas sp. F29]|uniref:DNA mismatch repair protein MutS n=1 Tax=Thermosulfurimonas sp. F29 TaxID=2867247 RepID=UPI001C82A1A9|nr:DNA mismatch repair protein MutS [Thermosulfurimonas sp. F29]MBX6422256.1 DNA mismatch repair protein MutS [Thermosulfurimonas sp. F29]